jgi:N-acetylglucosamine kinase-like BadF-type ATPase
VTRYFLGLDVGNTKTHALVIDEEGQAVGFARGRPANHESSGEAVFRETMQTVTQEACKQAGIGTVEIAGMGFGIAGYDWDSDLPMMQHAIEGLGINAPYVVVNDAVPGLIAGAKQGWGVCIASGTSCNCRGRDQHGREGRVTGEGMIFAEAGGGSELVYKAVGAISKAWSKRGPATMLTQLFMEHYGETTVIAMLEGLARGKHRAKATDAPIVFKAIEAGDEAAIEAMRWVARELGDLANGVIRQLEIEALAFEVVLAGSFYKGSPMIAEIIKETVRPVAPKADFVRLNAPPTVGAAMLGMEQAGVDFTRVREHIIETTARLEAEASA